MVITGTSGNNSLRGSNASDDVIRGLGGNDDIIGFKGNDTLDGGTGNDTLAGREGDDVLRGGSGDDVLIAGQGTDDLDGGGGNDSLSAGDFGVARGGAGQDTLSALFSEAVQLFGDDGRDRLESGRTPSTLFGGAGADQLAGVDQGFARGATLTGADFFGEAGDDTLSAQSARLADGGDGDDFIETSGLGTTVRGGDGDDTISPEHLDLDNAMGELLIGGPGIDRLFYTPLGDDPLTYVVDVAAGTVQRTLTRLEPGAGEAADVMQGVDTIRGIEIVFADNADDTLRGSDQELESLAGLGGDDLLIGRGGIDVINPGQGDDTAFGGAGLDILDFGLAFLVGGNEEEPTEGGVLADLRTGRATGHTGDDVFSGFEGLSGSAFDDTLVGDKGNNPLSGEEGDDDLQGLNGSDVMIGGAGEDTLRGGRGADYVDGDEDNDRVFGGRGADSLAGFEGVDTLTGGQGADLFFFGSDFETEIVTDFAAADAVVVGRGDLVRSFSAFKAAGTEVEGDLVFEFGRDVLILENTALADFKRKNLVFFTEDLLPEEVLFLLG